MQSPDVELVEPEALLVKEEKVQAHMSRDEEAEGNMSLIRDDGESRQKHRGCYLRMSGWNNEY